MAETLKVVAQLEAKPGSAESLRVVLEALVEPTRAEAGCVRYELWQDLDRAERFFFVEEWASREAVDAHLGTEHVQSALAAFPDLLAAELDLAFCGGGG